MERLTIKELAVYLPYGLKVWNTDMEVDFSLTIQEQDGNTVDIETVIEYNKVYKPLLRPMSDLFKLIDWDNNGDPYMIGYKYGVEKVSEDGVEFYANEYSAEYCESPTCHVDITSINWWLFEHHFDVFGLIYRGLAIPIDGKELEGE